MIPLIGIIDDGLLISFLAGIVIAISFPVAALIAICIKHLSNRIKSSIVSFGAGIFFATISFSLVEESVNHSNTLTLIIGFASGSILFSIANYIIKEKHSKKHKNNKIPLAESVIGETLDTIPEGLFVGIIVDLGLSHLIAAIIALFLGNLATTIQASRNMFERGYNSNKIIKIWLLIFVSVIIATITGYLLIKHIPIISTSIILGFAAGALLAMITESLLPEGFKGAKYSIGLPTSFGFILGYILFHFL